MKPSVFCIWLVRDEINNEYLPFKTRTFRQKVFHRLPHGMYHTDVLHQVLSMNWLQLVLHRVFSINCRLQLVDQLPWCMINTLGYRSDRHTKKIFFRTRYKWKSIVYKKIIYFINNASCNFSPWLTTIGLTQSVFY